MLLVYVASLLFLPSQVCSNLQPLRKVKKLLPIHTFLKNYSFFSSPDRWQVMFYVCIKYFFNYCWSWIKPPKEAIRISMRLWTGVGATMTCRFLDNFQTVTFMSLRGFAWHHRESKGAAFLGRDLLQFLWTRGSQPTFSGNLIQMDLMQFSKMEGVSGRSRGWTWLRSPAQKVLGGAPDTSFSRHCCG